MAEILNNQTFVWGAMAIIIFVVTQGLKWILVKPYTQKLNGRAKTILNSLILVIAFGVAILCEYLYSSLWLKISSINIDRILTGWSGASSVFAIFEVVVKTIKPNTVIENPFKTNEAKNVDKLIKEVVDDGKINKEDSIAVKDFADKLNKVQ